MSLNISSETHAFNRAAQLPPGQLISLKEATRLLPGTPHISTLHRWRLRGIRGLRLPMKLIGGKRFLDLADWELWTAKVTCAADGTPKPIRTTRARQRAILAAERALAKEGIGRPYAK